MDAPFKLPLRPEEDTGAGIVDDNGKYCIALRGHGINNAKAKRAYIIAAVNQHADLLRERDHYQSHYEAAQANWTAGLDENDTLRNQVEGLRTALRSAEAFIAVMFGRGPDAVIPETVRTPLGVDVKVGEIVREIRAALRASEPKESKWTDGVTNRPENVTRDAQRKCAEWLSYCLSIGWSKDMLDKLETLWWEHHDWTGRLVSRRSGDGIPHPRTG